MSLKKIGLPYCLTFIVIYCVAMFGCATLGKKECLQADWYTIGYEDGAMGYQASRIGKHREACAKHEVKPDFKSYDQGRMTGLREYCTIQKGYAIGSRGRGYNNVCPESLEPDFFEGYQKGKIVYAAKREVRQEQDLLKKIFEEIDAIEQTLDAYENELIKNGTTRKRRRYLLQEIKTLTDEHRYLLNQAAEQEVFVGEAQLYLKELQEQAPY